MPKLGIFAIGAVSGVALTAIGLVAFLWIAAPTPQQRVAKEIEWRENQLGYSCSDVQKNAAAFINGPLGRIIKLGQEGGDWAYEAFIQHHAEIHALKESVLQCDLLTESKISSGLASMNDFRKMHDFLSPLDIYTTAWGDKPPHASGLKPEAFKQIATLYRDLTAGSNGRPTSGAAKPERYTSDLNEL